MMVFGRSAVVMALPCCPSREPHAPTWGAPGLSRGRFLSLEGRGVVPGGFRSGVRWIQETGQVVNDRLDEVLEKPNEWDREVRARRAGSDRSAV